MAREKSAAPATQLAHYDTVIATIAGVERKGAASSYTSLNGHMFSFLDKTGAMSLRLPKDARAQFLLDHGTQLSVQHGAVMKEYVVVPAALLADTGQLKPYFALSHAYIATLKPKPTKRPAKKTGAKE